MNMIRVENLPFTYNDLLSIYADNSINISFKIDGKQIENKFTFGEQNSVFVLVDGGWLPLFLLNFEVNLLLDSNIIGVLSAISKNNKESATIQADWAIKLSNITSPNIWFNPLLYALEGNQFEVPNSEKIKQSYLDASIKTDITQEVVKIIKSIYYERFC